MSHKTSLLLAAGGAALTTALLAAAPASAQVCYQLPFSNPNLSDGWGSTCCGRSNPHRGVDFPQASGTAVPAVADGVVDRVTWTDCLGNVVVIRHADGMYSGYAHLSATTVSAGAQVRQRDTIGRVGSTGTCTTGPHLHLTMSPNAIGYTSGATVDPYAYITSHTTCDCDRGVDTPHGGRFTFSCDGPNAGQTCVNVNEPSDPTTWGDNFVCTSRDHGLQWSYRGPIDGLECAGVHESSSPSASAWADNFLCLPPQADVRLAWSSAGPIAGRSCFHWNEPQALQQSWSDNYLCVSTRSDYSAGGFTFSSDGPNADQVCVSLAEPADPDSWADNYLCTASDEGLVWSTAGPVDGMRCTHILETAGNSGEGWDDNYLCVPEGSPWELAWRSNGPIAGQECLRFNEAADPDGSWGDNYLCVSQRPPEPEPDAGSPAEDAALASEDASGSVEDEDAARWSDASEEPDAPSGGGSSPDPSSPDDATPDDAGPPEEDDAAGGGSAQAGVVTATCGVAAPASPRGGAGALLLLILAASGLSWVRWRA